MLLTRFSTYSKALVIFTLFSFNVGLAAPSQPFGQVLAANFGEVSGLSYAIVEAGKLTEAGGFGVADISTGEEVTAETPFRIASLTKPLSAALLLSAAQEGATDLGAPLQAASSKFRRGCPSMKLYFAVNRLPYLEDIPCESDDILVRHVLTHTAKTPPGSKYSYNGFLFGLLSDEIGDAIVGGGDDNFVRAVRQKIIVPLQLEHTAAGVTDDERADVVSRLAAPHQKQDGEWVVGSTISEPLNAGAGLIASAKDMAKIDIAYRDRLVSDHAVWKQMTTPTVLADGSHSPYGMGWFVQEVEDRKVLWHYGHQPNAYSGLWIKDVEHGRTLIVLANSSGLAAGYNLHEGDITRSPLAQLFLNWSSRRAALDNL